MVNHSKKGYHTTRGVSQRVEDRLYIHAEQKLNNIAKLKRDLTPSFRPNINKNTWSILKNSAKKVSKYQKLYESPENYHSLQKVSSLIKPRNFNNENINEFMKEINSSKSFYNSKGIEDFGTKGQTDTSMSSLNFVTKQKNLQNDEFRNFLDSYEQNLSKAIIIEEDNVNTYNTHRPMLSDEINVIDAYGSINQREDRDTGGQLALNYRTRPECSVQFTQL